MVSDWRKITIFSVCREKMAGDNCETIRTRNPGRQFSFSTFFRCQKKVEISSVFEMGVE